MNNQSPLIPQGSLLEQKNKGRARVKIAVFFVLAIHGIGLLALLMQGCRRDAPATPPEPTNNAALAPIEASGVDTNPPQAGTAAATVPPPVPEVPTPPAAGTEYTIAKGDTFSTIATHFHVSVKAITEANPGVDPAKLQIGKKIHIPPPPVTAAATGAVPVETPSGEKIYPVKSGDNLSTIAHQFGTTVRAIRTANDLKTDSIKVGQKLKIPVKAAAPSAPTGTAPPAPAPATTPAPR